MSDAVLIDVHHPPSYGTTGGGYPPTSHGPNPPSSPPSPPPLLPITTVRPSISTPLPFRQQALWAASALFFSFCLTAVLYAFLTSPSARKFLVTRANALFAVPYVLSLLVVLLCLAPCTPAAPREQLWPAISSPADCCLILLVLLEWATCVALVLVTLIAVHDGLMYVGPDGLIVPNTEAPPDQFYLPPPPHLPPDATPADGISRNAPIVLLVPIFFFYCLFNFVMHFFSCLQALSRRRRGLNDTDMI